MLEYVCCSSAYVNKHDDQGYTKLHHAAMTGNFAECKSLVRLGADLDIRDQIYGGTAAIWASEEHPEIVKFLHEKGADIHACDKYGDSCVMLAAKGGQLDLVKYLYNQGANIHVLDKTGTSALMFAARKGHLDIVKFLQGCGVDIYVRTNNRRRTHLRLRGIELRVLKICDYKSPFLFKSMIFNVEFHWNILVINNETIALSLLYDPSL